MMSGSPDLAGIPGSSPSQQTQAGTFPFSLALRADGSPQQVPYRPVSSHTLIIYEPEHRLLIGNFQPP